ncbi:MAG: alpha-hydroxy-acid oxidizing protein, partial [Eubacteriales bacterium]|nr:alpha-hydroxy-acid oxidizing protein [Eubacteriales bacterium]
RVCAGEVPGMGGTGTGASFKANIEALARYRFNMRTIHGVTEPETAMTLFDCPLDTPILAAPMTGTPYNMGGALTELEFITAVIQGSRLAGSIGCSGDGADPTMFDAGLKAIAGENGWGITFIKPRAHNEIVARLRRAEAAGARAVGIDIDGAGLVTMVLKGQPVSPKTVAELRKVIALTALPFVLKGIMTPDEATLAMEAGAKAIVVSNHGGRILDHSPGAAEVLPAIVEAVGTSVTVLADGGVRSGSDVLKLLALGARAVLVGRPLVVGAFGGGTDGVRTVLARMTSELRQAMILTGCQSVQRVEADILYRT